MCYLYFIFYSCVGCLLCATPPCSSLPHRKNVYALAERDNVLSKDPDVRKFDPQRIQCNICDDWVAVDPDEHTAAIEIWLVHRVACRKNLAQYVIYDWSLFSVFLYFYFHWIEITFPLSLSLSRSIVYVID